MLARPAGGAEELTEHLSHPDAVLLANVLLDFAVLVPDDIETDRPRFRVSPRIVDGRLVPQRVEILSREAFDDVKKIGVGIADHIDPAALIEAHDVDDQGVAFPVPDRMS